MENYKTLEEQVKALEIKTNSYVSDYDYLEIYSELQEVIRRAHGTILWDGSPTITQYIINHCPALTLIIINEWVIETLPEELPDELPE